MREKGVSEVLTGLFHQGLVSGLKKIGILGLTLTLFAHPLKKKKRTFVVCEFEAERSPRGGSD